MKSEWFPEDLFLPVSCFRLLFILNWEKGGPLERLEIKSEIQVISGEMELKKSRSVQGDAYKAKWGERVIGRGRSRQVSIAR